MASKKLKRTFLVEILKEVARYVRLMPSFHSIKPGEELVTDTTDSVAIILHDRQQTVLFTYDSFTVLHKFSDKA